MLHSRSLLRLSIGDTRQRRYCLSWSLHLYRDSPDDAPVLGFDIDPPIAWIKALLEAIGSIAALAATRDLDGNSIRMDERPLVVRTEVPMMINCRVEIDRRKDGGEAIDRLVRGIRRI